MGNQEQIDYWNGEAGERWAREDERMARLLEPIAMLLLDHIAPLQGLRAIDIGCGGGSQSVLLAKRLGPSGQVLGVDVSGPLLTVARQRAETLPTDSATISFLQADASNHAFAPGSADLLFSRFGVMFFDDPTTAFGNLREALSEGGRLGFCCWQSLQNNPWVREPFKAALAQVPAPEAPDPHAPGPFAFADDQRVAGILQDSGFDSVRIEGREVGMAFGNGGNLQQTCAELVNIGPVSRLLQDQPDNIRQRVVGAVAEAMAPYFIDGRLSLQGAVWLVTAEASGA
jgi:SAM-dependent methyltransferase